jgi:hypothetical protein
VYVVIEWNQASGRPGLATDEVFDTEEQARSAAKEYTDSRGHRRESYSVHAVEDDWLWRSDEEANA